MAVRDDRGDVKQTSAGFRGPLMVQSLTSAKSKFLSLSLDSIMEAIRTSADMTTDENSRKRLKIVYSAGKASFKTFDSNAHDTDDRSRVEELCEEYISPDYKQS